ncbi:LLM class F420-dependent oxidoreductase [Rhizocola hellebori]|uniref:LLM class F420-dependent oxidoreductase n=1 Tax=Rhizocola hellebori TaxID=1392758 RepID=A0A8J3QCQ0_9ACTN|nr:LLM class F420-dependent oxidoreductase [Rhizocola hellebori]GIH08206.1 LLM class F420-dependent oxidoreductase [Rhizocola hellebori]
MTETLKFALYGLHRGSSVDPQIMARRARAAEAAGFEALWVGDHIALPFDAPDPADEPRLETIVALTYLAAVTSRVRLGAAVLVLPQRQPVLLAKQIASLDVLAGGRLTVGIGVGYVEQELSALGVPMAGRGERADEYLEAMRVLWDEPPPVFDGSQVSFAGILQRPRPVQRPHPPIVVGGESPAAYRRAVRSGNGWYGWELDLDKTAEAISRLSAAAERYGRPENLGPLEITITPPGMVDVATARRYAELGVHRLAFQPPTMAGNAIDELISEVGETLVGKVDPY